MPLAANLHRWSTVRRSAEASISTAQPCRYCICGTIMLPPLDVNLRVGRPNNCLCVEVRCSRATGSTTDPHPRNRKRWAASATSPHHGHMLLVGARSLPETTTTPSPHSDGKRGAKTETCSGTRGRVYHGSASAINLFRYSKVSVSSCDSHFSIYFACLARLLVLVIDDAIVTGGPEAGVNTVILVYRNELL